MIANKEKCADQSKSECDYNEFRRLRYFHGMLLDDNDFQAEQEYHAGKRRLLNRMLHGSGIVCGLDLKGKKDGQWIEVTSGLALDCSGNEIWVPRKQHIDLAALLPPKDKVKDQPECKEDDDDSEVKTYYIGIRYDEKPSNPVSVYLPSGSCEERTCENSRYKEGFCVEIVECCQEKYRPGFFKRFCECGDGFKANPDELPLCPSCDRLEGQKLCQCLRLEEFCEQSVPCPECNSCDKPCHVILGKITVKECGLVSLCINDCRQYVLTGRMVQHMLVSVLAGGEQYFHMDVSGKKIPIPDVRELAQNPIKALCWWLRYKYIEGGKFEMNLCDVKDQPPPRDDVSLQLSAMKAELDTLKQQNSAIVVELNKVKEGNKTRLEPAEDTQKQPAAKTPKAPPK